VRVRVGPLQIGYWPGLVRVKTLPGFRRNPYPRAAWGWRGKRLWAKWLEVVWWRWPWSDLP